MSKSNASKIKVKMLEDGKWSDHPRDPVMHVKAGDIVEMSPVCAKHACDGGKATMDLNAGTKAAVPAAGASRKR